MSQCCTTKNNKPCAPKDAVCPANGKRYKQVKLTTILHHVTHPWKRTFAEQAYYYCSDPECEVVYFGEDMSTIVSDEMRIDQQTRKNTICYCFDVSNKDLNENKEICKAFIIAQTKHSTCDCEIRNPSGKCCLKDFK